MTHTRARTAAAACVWWFGLRFHLSITSSFYKFGVPLRVQPKVVHLELIYSQTLSSNFNVGQPISRTPTFNSVNVHSTNPKMTSSSYSLINGFDESSSLCDLPCSKEHVISLDPPQKTCGPHSILSSKLAQNKPIKTKFSNKEILQSYRFSSRDPINSMVQ